MEVIVKELGIALWISIFIIWVTNAAVPIPGTGDSQFAINVWLTIAVWGCAFFLGGIRRDT